MQFEGVHLPGRDPPRLLVFDQQANTKSPGLELYRSATSREIAGRRRAG